MRTLGATNTKPHKRGRNGGGGCYGYEYLTLLAGYLNVGESIISTNISFAQANYSLWNHLAVYIIGLLHYCIIGFLDGYAQNYSSSFLIFTF